jgi:hypothetical protein
MAYGEALPTDSASKKFEGLLADNGAGVNVFAAKAGVKYRSQNGEVVADPTAFVVNFPGMFADMALYKPTPGITDQTLTVSDAVVQFAALNASTKVVVVSVEGAGAMGVYAYARATFDGSNPTSGNGHILEPQQYYLWSKEMAAAAKFIRAGIADCNLVLSELTTVA